MFETQSGWDEPRAKIFVLRNSSRSVSGVSGVMVVYG